MGTIRSANKSVLKLFKGSWKRIGLTARCFTSRLTLSPGNLTSRNKVFKKKRHRFPELPTCIAEFLCVTYVIHVLVGEYLPHSLSRYEAKPACAEHPCLSGSTNPCPTDIHMKPFSTSVFKSSHLNVCYYHQDLHQELFYSGLRQELHSKPTPCPNTQQRFEYRTHA